MGNKARVKKISTNRVFWAIIALLASLLLWVYVTSTEGSITTEDYPGIPVEFVGEETLRESKGLIITDRDVTSISVKLSGSRGNLSKISKTSLKAVVDLSTINTDADTERAYELQYPAGVDAGDITIEWASTNVISFYVDRLSKLDVPVEYEFEGSIAVGYTVDTITFDPAMVRITGPKKELDLVDHALVVIERKDIDETLSYNSAYTLIGKDGEPVEYKYIELVNETVALTMPILSTKVVPLDVDIIAGGGAARENCKIDIEPMTITLAGDAAMLDGVNKISLATVDLADFEATYSQTYPIVINNELENLSGAIEATVAIEIKGMETRSFKVTNLNCTNVAEGYNAEFYAESAEVRIRGTAEALDKIASNNLRAVADLTDYKNSTGIIPVPIRFDIDGVTGVGVVGEYKMYVIVSMLGAEEGNS